jgi:hypothetical protein
MTVLDLLRETIEKQEREKIDMAAVSMPSAFLFYHRPTHAQSLCVAEGFKDEHCKCLAGGECCKCGMARGIA